MKYFTIIGGVNGTGKSSLTGVLCTLLISFGRILDAEKIAVLNDLTLLEGEKEALRRMQRCLKEGLSFALETQLNGNETERIAAEAKNRGYSVRLFYVGLDSPEECLIRIENRVKHGGHSFPEPDVMHSFAERWDAVERILPYCDVAHFFDNNNGFVEVAEYLNGELVLKGEDRPAWILELAEHLKKLSLSL